MSSKESFKPKSQEELVYEHICQHGSIDTYEAISLYKCTRLSATIYNLRKRGINITAQRTSALADGKARSGAYAIYSISGGGLNG